MPCTLDSTAAHATDLGTGHGAPRLFPQIEPGNDDVAFLEDVLANRFTFAGETHDLGHDVDWLKNPSADVEWHILLHKFYYAVGLAQHYAATGDQRMLTHFVDLVESWIAQTPVNFIAADVTGRRVQNWIYASYIFARAGASFAPEFEARLHASIDRQIERMLDELAPSRNHRALELYAVFLTAIALPALTRAHEWLELAVREMVDNMRADILGDGVHCELSTDYHHIALRNYLLFVRVARANGIELPAAVQPLLCSALDFAMHIHRPDGTIPALSDADSRSFDYLLAWGAELFGRNDYRFVATRGRAGRPPATSNASFPVSGYHVQRSSWRGRSYADARFLVFDCGPIGAGNHGHLDALSIEAYAYGRRLIVDPGRYTYDEQGDVNWRAQFRGTAAHNTVAINGSDQAIYVQRGARKRVREPHPRVTFIDVPSDRHICALHGRIDSPNYPAIHDRFVIFVRERYWVIVDQLCADAPHDYRLNFQLDHTAHGHTRIEHRSGGAFVAMPGAQLILSDPTHAARIADGYVSEEYGIKHAAPRVSLARRAARTSFITFVLPHKRPPFRAALSGGRERVVTLGTALWTDQWRIAADGLSWSPNNETAHWRLPLELADV